MRDMAVKEKILGALEMTFEDLSLERLIDILLDAYNGKKKRIEELNAENARERERLHVDIEVMRRERERMRSDPLYLLHGDYFFECNGRRFHVSVQGSHIKMTEQQGKHAYMASQMTWAEWGR